MLYQFQHFAIAGYTKKEYGENLCFPAHLHNSFEFILVTEGSMEVMIDNKLYCLKKGESVLVFPNQVHSIQSTSSRHFLVIFSTHLVKAYSSKVAYKIPIDNRVKIPCYLIENMDVLDDDSSTVEKKGIYYCLCAEFDKNATYIERKNDDKNLLYTIFKYVEDNNGKNCDLSTVAQNIGFSYSYISRYFKKIVGVSYNSYLNSYRISKACYILENSDCTVLSCAMECGYDSLRSFNRNFMEITGKTPGQFRKNQGV